MASVGLGLVRINRSLLLDRVRTQERLAGVTRSKALAEVGAQFALFCPCQGSALLLQIIQS